MLDSQLLYINGSNLASSEGTTFPITNPMTGDHLYDCSSAGLEDYKIAIESAQAAFKSWSRTPPSSRRLSFLKAADIVGTYLTEGGEVNAKEILSCEVSAAKMWTLRNIESVAAVLRESAGLVTHIKEKWCQPIDLERQS